MPAVAGAGGKTAGGLRVRGSLDTSLIEKGFMRVKKGFDSIKGRAKSFGSDVVRMSAAVGGLVKKLSLLAIGGITAMVALAKSAPAVAPALAKMKVSMFKLKMALGDALAPAFERVAKWLDKFAVWAGNNKETIGAVANKVLDFAEAVGVKLWPYLKKIGDWAVEHPGMFAGIVAGLIIGPAVIAGIGAITGLIGALTGGVVSAGMLSALAYIAGIGAVGYAGYKVAEAGVDWVKKQVYEKRRQIPGTPEAVADIPFGARESIVSAGLQPTPGGRIGASMEKDRRFFLLRFWDSVWS